MLCYPESSPRKRGCFCPSPARQSSSEVFPAQAGVFPSPGKVPMSALCLPRASGGVSRLPDFAPIQAKVFPAQAGVFPSVARCSSAPSSLPRASGGCFPGPPPGAARVGVFPAQAGVFLPLLRVWH